MWEEYRDSVYDRMNRSIEAFEDAAHTHRISSGFSGPDGLPAYFRSLAEAKNQIQLSAAQADAHPETNRQDWEDRVEGCWEHVSAVIGDMNANGQEDALGDYAQPLKRRILDFVSEFRERLRHQRTSMTR